MTLRCFGESSIESESNSAGQTSSATMNAGNNISSGLAVVARATLEIRRVSGVWLPSAIAVLQFAATANALAEHWNSIHQVNATAAGSHHVVEEKGAYA